MQGMSRVTGKPLSGLDHIRQSVQDILSTPVGTRVMRPGYGSNLIYLVDHPADRTTTIRVVMAAAGALARWEPRIAINSIEVLQVGNGVIRLSIHATDVETQRAVLLENIEL
ncbi:MULTISPECIES: GPW/gp25 family protein [Serratia]|uniref:Gene 25-like lysozyme n=1 Tax=Serratia quinivorans TaxID=137545 RepID=A0A380AJV1_9GAMM|nr:MULTISPECIES: GPW/gp25 family protein [Serratia]RYM55442.1 baseplate assembly protein [Serratia proteamaculans]CAI1716981.1 Gene 25-like lysozyme [Serratia quinivorans]SUI43899.1 Gene 25-like lysozyme [Serratia quinivorans]SUI81991.1 Gene 25-like lysozyme [Serratia quinivorans]